MSEPGHIRASLVTAILLIASFFLTGCGSGTNTIQPAPSPPAPTGATTQFLYNTLFTPTGAGGLETFQIDSQTHRLTTTSGSTFDLEFPTAFPIGLVTDKNHQFLLTAMSSNSPGLILVQTYKRSSDGSLMQVTNMSLSGAATALAMDPQDRFFYIAAETTVPLVYVLKFDSSSGVLSLASTFQLQPATAGPGGLSTDSSGNFLYVSLQGVGGIAGIAELSVGPTGMLVQNGTASLAVPFPGPVLANSSSVYVGNQTGGIYAFSITSGSGALTLITGSPFATNTEQVLALLRTGNFLFVGTRSHQTPGPNGSTILDPATVFAFQIQNSGGLQAISGSPFQPAFNSQCLAVTGSFLYVGDQSNIQGFSINSSTGQLTSAFSQSSFSSTGCVTAP